MSDRPGPSDPADPLGPYRRAVRASNASDIGRLTRRHLARILAVVLAAAIYLPAMGLMTIQVAGGTELQELFDWLTGRCGASCSAREALATAIQIAPIIATAPVLVLIAWIWVKRGYRDDRDVSSITISRPCQSGCRRTQSVTWKRATATSIATGKDGCGRSIDRIRHRPDSARPLARIAEYRAAD